MPYLYCTTSVTLSSECLNYTEINRNSSLFTGTKMHSGNLLLEHERFITRTIWRRSGEVFLRYWETWKFTLVSNTTPNPQQTTVSCMPLFCLRISKNGDFSHSGKVCSGNHAGDQWIWCCVWPQGYDMKMDEWDCCRRLCNKLFIHQEWFVSVPQIHCITHIPTHDKIWAQGN